MTVDEEEASEAFDPLRDGPLRYLGYANEMGEAFAAWLPAFGVPASYCVALGYFPPLCCPSSLMSFSSLRSCVQHSGTGKA